MRILQLPRALCAFALLLPAMVFGRSSSVPDWVRRAAAIDTPGYVSTAAAVILLDQTDYTVAPWGSMTRTHRVVMRIIGSNAASDATEVVYYDQKADKVLNTNAWLIRKGEPVRPPDGVEWADAVVGGFHSLQEEIRRKEIIRNDAVAGDIFAAETVVEGPLLVADVGPISWGGIYPAVENSLTVTVPPGFKLAPVMVGQNPPVGLTTANGLTTIWTARDRPFILAEPLSPSTDPFTPRLFVRFIPPAGDTQFKSVELQTWADLTSWLAKLCAGQCDSSANLADSARKITAGCTTDLEKIRKLAAFVQKLRYVSVNTGLSRGYGYKPRKASQCFANGYGDCKDKANLLCAMLHEVGLTGFVAAAVSGDDGEVIPEFPSPSQFDHAIAAIQVPAGTDLPTVVATEKLGPILFFDPTDPFTEVGDLPAHLQGTRVLIEEPRIDALSELPRIPLAKGHNRIRKGEFEIVDEGGIVGRCSITGTAQAGAMLRASLFNASTDQLLKTFVSDSLGETVRAAKLDKLEKTSDDATGLAGISFLLAKRNYLQYLANGTAVAKFEFFDRGLIPNLPAPDRKRPIKLTPVCYHDEIRLTLPEGWTVEDTPAAVSVESRFGRYDRRFETVAGAVIEHRHVEINPQILPASDYADLKKFLGAIGKADRASALLRWKKG